MRIAEAEARAEADVLQRARRWRVRRRAAVDGQRLGAGPGRRCGADAAIRRGPGRPSARWRRRRGRAGVGNSRPLSMMRAAAQPREAADGAKHGGFARRRTRPRARATRLRRARTRRRSTRGHVQPSRPKATRDVLDLQNRRAISECPGGVALQHRQRVLIALELRQAAHQPARIGMLGPVKLARLAPPPRPGRRT